MPYKDWKSSSLFIVVLWLTFGRKRVRGIPWIKQFLHSLFPLCTYSYWANLEVRCFVVISKINSFLSIKILKLPVVTIQRYRTRKFGEYYNCPYLKNSLIVMLWLFAFNVSLSSFPSPDSSGVSFQVFCSLDKLKAFPLP